MSLLEELKRRNVLRVATAYVVSAWLIIQVVETVFPAFGFDDSDLRTVIILLAIGFLPAIIGAWFFEWTPEGIKRDDDSTGPSSSQTRSFDRTIIGILLVAVSYFAVDKFVLTETQTVDTFFGDRSIAVMPFEVSSVDEDQQFFATGITDEIRYLLGSVRDLRVMAERSSAYIHQNGMGLAQIREEFRVGHLLEGSVRIIGNTMRVSARLVETKTESQIWSDVYEREIDDVFKIQDDIAANVLHNLKIELREPLPNARSVNPRALALVQETKRVFQERPMDAAELMYPPARRAYELDPNYADGVKWLINSLWMQATFGLMSWDEAGKEIDELSERFAELAPDSGYLESGEGFDAEREGNFERAAYWYQRSLEKELTDSMQLRLAGRFALLIGKEDTAVRVLDLAVAVDPLCHQCRRVLSQCLMYRGGRGDYERALQVRERYLESSEGGQPFYSMLLLLTDRAEEVAAVWTELDGENSPQALSYLAMADFSMGDLAAANEKTAFMEQLLPNSEPGSQDEWDIRWSLANSYAWMGDADNAFKHLLPPSARVSYTDKLDVGNPVWDKVRDDPRWTEYRNAIGMQAQKLAAVEFDPWLPE